MWHWIMLSKKLKFLIVFFVNFDSPFSYIYSTFPFILEMRGSECWNRRFRGCRNQTFLYDLTLEGDGFKEITMLKLDHISHSSRKIVIWWLVTYSWISSNIVTFFFRTRYLHVALVPARRGNLSKFKLAYFLCELTRE